MKLEEPGACRSVIVSHGSFHMRPHCTYIYNIIYLYLDLREGFNFSPKGFRQNSCPNVFFLPEAFFSTRGWFLMQCLPKRDFGHFRPFAGYFCPFAVSFRPAIVRIPRKTCRSFRLKKRKTARRRKFLTKPEKADFSVQAENYGPL